MTCIPAIAGVPDDAGVTLVPHVASLPAGVVGNPSVAGVRAVACIHTDPGVHILADFFHTLLYSLSHIRLWTVTKKLWVNQLGMHSQAQQNIFTITLVSYIKEICSFTVL